MWNVNLQLSKEEVENRSRTLNTPNTAPFSPTQVFSTLLLHPPAVDYMSKVKEGKAHVNPVAHVTVLPKTYSSTVASLSQCLQVHIFTLKLLQSANHINYADPWKTDHFTSTRPKPPFCPGFHHRELLTQCDDETKIKSCRGGETHSVPSLGPCFTFLLLWLQNLMLFSRITCQPSQIKAH